MADTALRDAERALLSSPSDPETYARWVAAHLRSGGRDPRRAPRAGDEITMPVRAKSKAKKGRAKPDPRRK